METFRKQDTKPLLQQISLYPLVFLISIFFRHTKPVSANLHGLLTLGSCCLALPTNTTQKYSPGGSSTIDEELWNEIQL